MDTLPEIIMDVGIGSLDDHMFSLQNRWFLHFHISASECKPRVQGGIGLDLLKSTPSGERRSADQPGSFKSHGSSHVFGSNTTLVVTSASLVVTGALLGTKSY